MTESGLMEIVAGSSPTYGSKFLLTCDCTKKGLSKEHVVDPAMGDVLTVEQY
jgi:hypothetical protein